MPDEAVRNRTSLAAVLLLVATAAAIHFARAAADPEIRVLFVLNGVGFLALGALLVVPWAAAWRPVVRWTLLGYAAVTAALYVVWGATGGEWTVPAGPVSLAVELLLVGLLWRGGRRPVSSAARS